MKSNHLIRLATLMLLIILAVVLYAACGSRQEPPATANRAAASPAKSPAATASPVASEVPLPNAPAGDSASLYAGKCVVCHGPDGKGVLKGSPDFTSAAWQKTKTDQDLADTLKKGKKPMPPFEGKLTDDQIKGLITYVRAFGGK